MIVDTRPRRGRLSLLCSASSRQPSENYSAASAPTRAKVACSRSSSHPSSSDYPYNRPRLGGPGNGRTARIGSQTAGRSPRRPPAGPGTDRGAVPGTVGTERSLAPISCRVRPSFRDDHVKALIRRGAPISKANHSQNRASLPRTGREMTAISGRTCRSIWLRRTRSRTHEWRASRSGATRYPPHRERVCRRSRVVGMAASVVTRAEGATAGPSSMKVGRGPVGPRPASA
jgi:hypothetical protein